MYFSSSVVAPCGDLDGSALECFQSYLTDKTMCRSLAGSESRPAPLSYGIPQGSIPGPIRFSLHLYSQGYILQKQFYADDSQYIYVPLKKKDTFSLKPL